MWKGKAMNFGELNQLLWEEQDIEKVQRIEDHNVNDQNLPYDYVPLQVEQDSPKIQLDFTEKIISTTILIKESL